MDDVGPLGQYRVPRRFIGLLDLLEPGGRCGPSMLRFRDIGKLKKGDYSATAATLQAEAFGSPTPIPTAEPEEAQSWLWDQTLATNSISILVSRPKVGKSTLAGSIAVAVATGGQLLGRQVVPG